MNALLSVRGLDAFYGKAQALFGCSVHVDAGEVVALIGRNGTGKSTLLKSIMGLVASTGDVEFDGKSFGGAAPHVRALAGLGYVPEDRRIFTELTVRENLAIGGRGGKFDLDGLLELFPNLEEMLDRHAAQMSGGEQQMLALARTLAAHPRAVLLDEPSEGIAPLVVERVIAAVAALKAQGAAVLLSEQNLRFATATADRAVLMERGHIVGAATRDEMAQPSEAVRAVLGL